MKQMENLKDLATKGGGREPDTSHNQNRRPSAHGTQGGRNGKKIWGNNAGQKQNADKTEQKTEGGGQWTLKNIWKKGSQNSMKVAVGDKARNPRRRW